MLQPTFELPALGIYCCNCVNNITCYPYESKAITNEKPLYNLFNKFDFTVSKNLTVKCSNIFLVNELLPTSIDDDNIQQLEQMKSHKVCDILPEIISLNNAELFNSCDQLIELLSCAIKIRVTSQNQLCGMCLREKFKSSSNTSLISDFRNMQMTIDSEKCASVLNSTACNHARVAILYSGGIDSLILAALADKYVPEGEPIDLLNVAFSDNGTYDTNSINDFSLMHVPDRATAVAGLSQLNSKRLWNFVEINVGTPELRKVRENHIRKLIYPLDTVLDESIGCAIWFAARGEGWLRSKGIIYQSTARVVLVGMGSDEQLGGYSRHLNSYNRLGWAGLINEIKVDILRISERNMGRDDRVISDHAKEARFPFLDENVVLFLNSLPIWKKTILSLPRGVGDKLLLRLCAYRLGLKSSAALPKRAIQFGSRIAHIEGNKCKGSSVSQYLSHN